MWNTEFFLLVIFVACLAALLVLFGIRRYHYAINPLFIFAFFDIGLLTVLSGAVAYGLSDGMELGLTTVLYLSMVYILGFFLIFLPRRFYFPCLLFNGLLAVVGKTRGSAGYGGVSQWLLIMIALVLFYFLMISSGAGLLWLTDPRLAYLSYRAGSGYIYLMVQWVLLATLIYYIWTRKPRLTGLLWVVCLYSLAAYFTGSKSNMLAGIIVAGVYYNFYVKAVPWLLVVSGPFLMLGMFLVLLNLQQSYSGIVPALSYFRDYVETTAQFLVRFDEFGLHWGYAMFSDLWFYVPRVLYEEKPFEYGVVLIHKVLFPGAAAQGHTPGILPWALAYLDFGVIGVFVSGMFTGFMRRGAYESFLANRENSLAFILMIQLSLIPVFAYATFPFILVIGFFMVLFMRKRIVFISSVRK